MTLRQTWLVIVLTLLYLTVELSFNARLLDLVGAGASEDQLHSIEKFGRTMSGVAVSLFVLQWLLGRRERSGTGRPSSLGIIFWCSASGAAVFLSLHLLVDYLVLERTPGFRKTSVNILLLQRALVKGEVQLDGLNDDPALFSKPAGKAFLGLFPLMAISIDKLDTKIRAAKLELIARAVEEQADGPAGYHAQYVKARHAVRQQWQRYQTIPTAGDLDSKIARSHEKAWNEYLTGLGKRGWAPSSVPQAYQARVRHDVRRKVPVASDWDLADEAGFREAVAIKARRSVGSADGSVMIDGRRIPDGLSWPAFFAHGAVQARLQRELGAPAGVTVKLAYASGDEFTRTLFAPMVRQQARSKLVQYDAPEHSYANGAANGVLGLDSARAVIVPPVALFFSLIGAVLHIAKLVYLLALMLSHALPALRERARHLWPAPAAALCSMLLFLGVSDNAVTNSRLYGYMQAQMLAGSAQGSGAAMQAQLITRALHVVAVGQDYGYPFNELMRTRVLGGFDFGYQNEKK